ncbi:putative transport system permease [Yersinia enterocolitica]|uniref:Transport system permease n=1 Tax=Yersinia enterocolitica TaxID=630 RepID=A0A9P1V6W4_YEREN|nr:putative transport system permease [Yersinia enterocolitica]
MFKSQYLVRFWAPLPAVIAAGILSTYYFGLTGTFWAVTGEFTRWGGPSNAAVWRAPARVGLF